MFGISADKPDVLVVRKSKKIYKIVEKVDDETFVAPYTKSVYKKDEDYSAQLETNRSRTAVKSGLYGITNKKAARKFLNKKHKFYNPNKVAIECLVPAGTNYYFNPHTKEVMVEHLTVNGEVDIRRKR